MGGAELRARVDPAALAAQPLAVEQVSAGQLGTQPGAAQSLDRLAIGGLGVLALARAAPASAPGRPAPSRSSPALVAWASRSSASTASSGLPGPRGRLDQLRKRPRGDMQLGRLLARLLGLRQAPRRSGRGRCTGRRIPNWHHWIPTPCPSAVAFLAATSISAEASASAPRRPRGSRPRSGAKRAPVASAIASASAINERGRAKSPRQAATMPRRVQVERHRASSPASRTDCSRRTQIACQLSSSHSTTAATTRQPAPSQSFRQWDLAPRQMARCPPQRGAAAARPSVTRTERPSSSRSVGAEPSVGRGADRAARETSRRSPARARTARRKMQPARRPDRSRARARHPAARAVWPRSAAAPEPRRPRLEANAIWPRNSSTRARPSSSSGPASARRQQLESRVERASLQMRLRGGERALGSPRGIARQRDRSLQKRRRRRHAARGPAPDRPTARAQKRPPRRVPAPPPPDATPDDRGPAPDRSPPPTPGAPPGVPPPPPTRTRPNAPADGGISPARRSSATRRLRRSGGRRADSEALGRPPEQQRIADRLRRRDQQQTPRVLRQRLESSNEALLDPSRERLCVRAAQTRPPTASRSTRAAARATPAGSRGSRR